MSRLQFVVDSTPGCLARGLAILSKHDLNVVKIESSPLDSTSDSGLFTIAVDIQGNPEGDLLGCVVKELKDLLPSDHEPVYTSSTSQVVWFPNKMSDLDRFASHVFSYGAELDADHPGFRDQEYRERRRMITESAKKFKTGMKLPTIEYTESETQTWRTVFSKISTLLETHACKEHRAVFELMKQNAGFSPDKIPQLQEISDFLRSSTGFRLRPVMGLLSPRDFLNGLAFRVFHSTQYIRHHSEPMYTPEPDVCHELIGHVPLLADPDFAQFSQEIGLASLGATDEEITKLASVYWFTVEFGLCRENGELKAYGAGILSSFGELRYSIESNECQRVPFDPAVAASTEYPITSFQPLYFVASSFKSATEKIRAYSRTFKRPFHVVYDPYTEHMKVLNSQSEMIQLARIFQANATALLDAALHGN